MHTPDARDHSALIVNAGGEPRPQAIFHPARRGLVTTATYHRGVQVFELDVVARSGRWLCVRQDVDGWGEWLAWAPETDCEPLKASCLIPPDQAQTTTGGL